MQLTDTQLLTACLAVILPLSMLVYSNRRITEAKETLRAETAKLGAELQVELKLLRKDIEAGFGRMETALKVHELEHHK